MGDDIMLKSTSRFEQLKLEDKTVTECGIFQKAIVVTERKERLTEEVMNCKDPDEQSQDGTVTDSKTMAMKRKTSLTKITSCEDLIAEIFARLPLKSVIRLRCLSKSWYSRIASPDFICMYTLVRTMNSPEKVLIQHETCNESKGNLIEFLYTLHSKDRLPLRPRRGYMDVTPVKFPFWCLKIIGSCNGIVCFYQEDIGFVLWNFSVRRQVQILDPPFKRAVKEGYVGSLGFGFDSITHDYKIVGISEGKNANTIFIYSLKTNSWTEIDFPDSKRRIFGHQRACFLDGALHWVETRSLDETQKLREHIILTFSLKSHVFGTILLPEPCRKARDVYGDGDRIARELKIVDGCLALISSDTCTLSYIRVWVMKEYGNVPSWTMVHEFDWIKQFNGVGIEKLLTNGGLLLDKRGTNNFLDNDEDGAWYEVYYPDRCLSLEVLKLKKTSGKLGMEMYVESLELLDKGTPCGKTIFRKKKKPETTSRGKKRGKKGRLGS